MNGPHYLHRWTINIIHTFQHAVMFILWSILCWHNCSLCLMQKKKILSVPGVRSLHMPLCTVHEHRRCSSQHRWHIRLLLYWFLSSHMKVAKSVVFHFSMSLFRFFPEILLCHFHVRYAHRFLTVLSLCSTVISSK